MIKKSPNIDFNNIQYTLDAAIEKENTVKENEKTIIFDVNGPGTYTLKIQKEGQEVHHEVSVKLRAPAAPPPPAPAPAPAPAPEPAAAAPTPAAAPETYTFGSFEINGDQIDTGNISLETKEDASVFNITANVNWESRGTTAALTTTPKLDVVDNSQNGLTDSYTFNVQKPTNEDSQDIEFKLTYNEGETKETKIYRVKVIFTPAAGGSVAGGDGTQMTPFHLLLTLMYGYINLITATLEESLRTSLVGNKIKDNGLLLREAFDKVVNIVKFELKDENDVPIPPVKILKRTDDSETDTEHVLENISEILHGDKFKEIKQNYNKFKHIEEENFYKNLNDDQRVWLLNLISVLNQKDKPEVTM